MMEMDKEIKIIIKSTLVGGRELVGSGFGFKNAIKTGIREYRDAHEDKKPKNNPISSIKEINDQELITKALYYLSMPVSESLKFKNFDIFIDNIAAIKKEEGKKFVYEYMTNKYSRILERLSENLQQNKSAVSLSIIDQIENSLKEDRKKIE